MVEIGIQLDTRYQVQETLGEGSMGVVYRAYDRLRNEIVALKRVKVLPSALNFEQTDQQAALALAHEFRTLAGLRHPNIVAVLDYGFDAQKQPFYTMQFLKDAQPLNIYAAPLTEAEKAKLFIEILQALAYLHRRRIIHRDLKPSNVLVTADGIPRVLDFGIAVHESQTHAASENAVLAGTLAYMAPELFKGSGASIASDLYALGVMLYELFTGRLPFDITTLSSYFVNVLQLEPDYTLVPHQLKSLLHSLLNKAPEQRLQDAYDAIEALVLAFDMQAVTESPLHRESFLQASTFVGREDELTMLTTTLDACFAGQSSMWLVGGESGAGKSRLIEELRPYALVQGALVLRGQAIAEGGVPYQLWRDVVTRLMLDTSIEPFEVAVLSLINPQVKTLYEEDAPETPDITGAAAIQQLAITLINLFNRQPRPILILLEDLQWATSESMGILQQLAAQLNQFKHVFVIGTYRIDEQPALPETFPAANTLLLKRLDETAIQMLAQSMLGSAADNPALLDLLQRETEGNAFFMVETVRALANEAGRLGAVGKRIPEKVLAGGVQDIIQRRLARIPEIHHTVLKLTAVAGRTLDKDILRHATDLEQLEAFITAAAMVGVLEIYDDVWRFSHDKLREAVLSLLTINEQQQYHATIADAIEQTYPDNEAYHERLLQHWQAAGNSEREAHYLLPVMHRFVRVRNDYHSALRLFNRGLKLYPEDSTERGKLLVQAAEAYALLGESSSAEDYSAQALTIAEALNDMTLMAQIFHGRVAIAYYQGDFKTANANARKSLELKRAIGDKKGIAASLNNLGLFQINAQNYKAAKAFLEESLRIKQEINDQFTIPPTLNNLGLVAVYEDDHDEAQRYFEECLMLRKQFGDRHGIAESLYNLASLAALKDDFAQAEAYHRESLDLLMAIDNKEGIARTLEGLGAIQRAQRNPQFLSPLRQSLSLSLEINALHIAMRAVNTFAWAYMQSGDLQQAALLSGLVNAHPSTSGDLRADALAKNLEALKSTFDEEALQALLTKGAALDLHETAQRLVQEPAERFAFADEH